MSALSWRQAAILAALLDADGAPVPYAVLGDLVGTAGVNDDRAIRQYAERIRALGIDAVLTVAGVGLRLGALPPDWALDTILAVLDCSRRLRRLTTHDTWRMAS